MCALSLWSVLPSAFAYEIGTHAYVAKLSTDASVLSSTHPQTMVSILGITRLDENDPVAGRFPASVLDHRYYDNVSSGTIDLSSAAASDLFERYTQDEEGKIFERLIVRGYLPGVTTRSDWEHRVAAWVMRGAIREDDNDVGPYSLGERDDDPWSNVFRAGRHFYDPANERALDSSSTCGLFGCVRATEWAIGRSDVLSGSGTITAGSENHFSWQHARNQYWWSLTFKPSDIGVNTYGQAQRRFSAGRSKRFASTLKSVGQVVHLVQDMAQPQHTRNDSHGPPFVSQLSGDSAADGAFEAFTEARLFRELPEPGYTSPLSHFDGTKLSIDDLPPLRVRGSVPYPVPTFAKAVHYFTTRAVDAAPSARRGLADISNRGFFTATTLPSNIESGSPDPLADSFRDAPPLPADQPAFYQEFPLETKLFAGGAVVRSYHLVAQVPDVLAPSWNMQSGLFDEYSEDGRMPLLTASQARIAADLIAVPSPEATAAAYSVSYDVFTATADAMLPRAVAYGTGAINYFFRGKLDVDVPDMALIAVMNQGETHSVDGEGYPRRPDQSIFGFTKLRLKVRNATAEIVESGSGTHSVQNASNGQLVAIARYHRNACYKIDLSGQRAQGYAAVPPAPITAPTCTAALPERTDYEEISVSAPMAISGAGSLPGMVGSTAQAWVDKVFDFSADPIPVNATDLFIQVVYRGQLGEEPDGIAVGRLDVREPTFIAAYNGTDYRWTGSVWTPGSIGTTTRAADYFHLCGGNPTKLLYRNTAAPALRYAVGTTPPDAVRLAIITTAPPPPSGNRVFRAQPTMIPSPSAEPRVFTTKGAIRQAGREIISVSTTATDCTSEPISGADAWCNTPSQRRRGQILGDAQQAIYYAPIAGNSPVDVDAAGLPAYPSLTVRTVGENRFNDDEPLINCPTQPALTQEQESMVQLLEEAAALGIDVN